MRKGSKLYFIQEDTGTARNTQALQGVRDVKANFTPITNP
jgi:hypothetical protein